MQKSKMAAIFREKQRKNTKKITDFGEKETKFQAQMLFFMPFIWSLLFLKQTCFSQNLKKTRWPPYFSAKV